MKRGDIYMVSLDPAQGREQQGTRPVLIISANEINQATRIAVILPITSGGNFARAAGLSVSFDGCGYPDSRRGTLRPAENDRSDRSRRTKSGELTKAVFGRGPG